MSSFQRQGSNISFPHSSGSLCRHRCRLLPRNVPVAMDTHPRTRPRPSIIIIQSRSITPTIIDIIFYTHKEHPVYEKNIFMLYYSKKLQWCGCGFGGCGYLGSEVKFCWSRRLLWTASNAWPSVRQMSLA